MVSSFVLVGAGEKTTKDTATLVHKKVYNLCFAIGNVSYIFDKNTVGILDKQSEPQARVGKMKIQNIFCTCLKTCLLKGL